MALSIRIMLTFELSAKELQTIFKYGLYASSFG